MISILFGVIYYYYYYLFWGKTLQFILFPCAYNISLKSYSFLLMSI